MPNIEPLFLPMSWPGTDHYLHTKEYPNDYVYYAMFEAPLSPGVDQSDLTDEQRRAADVLFTIGAHYVANQEVMNMVRNLLVNFVDASNRDHRWRDLIDGASGKPPAPAAEITDDEGKPLTNPLEIQVMDLWAQRRQQAIELFSAMRVQERKLFDTLGAPEAEVRYYRQYLEEEISQHPEMVPNFYLEVGKDVGAGLMLVRHPTWHDRLWWVHPDYPDEGIAVWV